jgi:hypothetical protein
MKDRFFSFSSQDKISWILAIGAGLGMMVAAFMFPGGDDLYRYYLPFENGCLECGYVPFYTQWFLLPLRLLPDYPYAWPVWTVFSILGFMGLAYLTGINPFLFMIAFPMLGQIWLGQIDFLICLGLVIFLFDRNPYWRGFGIILALAKPQLTVLPLFFTLLIENPKSLMKLLVIPVLILLISILIYGVSWPLLWASNASANLPIHVWRLASLDIWKFGIFLIPLPLVLKDQRKRLEAGLLVSALATPFFGVYSYVTFLLLNSKWWTVAFSYIWVIGYFWFRESAMRFAWILPLIMLMVLVYEGWMKRRNDIYLPEK